MEEVDFHFSHGRALVAEMLSAGSSVTFGGGAICQDGFHSAFRRPALSSRSEEEKDGSKAAEPIAGAPFAESEFLILPSFPNRDIGKMSG